MGTDYDALYNISDEGQLTAFNINNDQLNIDLEHPLNIDCQPSYDGTVNLIINDDINPPRIINSRFSKIENNRYRLITRNQINQTNIYDKDRVDQQTRLFRNLNSIPRIDLINEYNSGQLMGGNYTFYIKFADDDYNKTDIVAESGQISVYKGYTVTPSSVSGTILDERTDKSITLKISNIDTSFSKVYLYFSRETCDNQGFKLTKCGAFKEPYNITDDTLYITVNGYEEIEDMTVDQLNIQYNIVTAAKTQVQVQNMLFLGNVQQTVLDVANLQNLSYYINVQLLQNESVGYIDPKDYTGPSDAGSSKLEYYNPKNIYYKLGYWPDEIYRLGVVYIMRDDSLTPVFNLRGCVFDSVGSYNFDINEANDIVKKPRNTIIGGENYENTFGVFKLPKATIIKETSVNPLYFKMSMATNVKGKLKDLGVKGFFFVRQKRIPTTLAQGLSIGIDRGSYIPMLYDSSKGKYFSESFLSQKASSKGKLSSSYEDHIMETDQYQCTGLLSLDAICSPELQSAFDGSDFVLEQVYNEAGQLTRNKRYNYITQSGNLASNNYSLQTGVVYVGSNTPMKYIWSKKFATKVGSGEELSQFGLFEKQDLQKTNVALVRGQYTPFLGTNQSFAPNVLYDIKIPNYSASRLIDYFNIRGADNSPFYAISHRYEIDDSIINTSSGLSVFRGDCYSNTITIRINRNFIDSDVPLYDTILDSNTWVDHYNGVAGTRSSAEEETNNSNLITQIVDGVSSALNKEKASEIEKQYGYYLMNRADVNAVPLGMWITFKCLSNYNLGLRTVDYSHTDEQALMGSPRGFYPVTSISTAASGKIEDSSLLNAGYNTTLGKRYNFIVPNVPYIKELFDNRIMFSRMQQNDAFQNFYRIFQGLDYQDIDRQYGAIVKFIPWDTNILCVFEHGVGIIPINEKALISTNTGQSIHMYGAGVLQNQITVINPDFGSIWQESIIRTPIGVYGVDTYAKKIWRVTQQGGMEIISDMKVQRFLNDHIKLSESDKYPTVALKNVKTHYNNYKGDVMFTFYNSEQDETWNLCFNERVNKWITRYSWTPLYSANIDNIFYSLDQKRARLYSLVYKNKIKTWGLQSETIEYSSTGSFNSNLTLLGYDSYNLNNVKIASIYSSYIDDSGNEIVLDLTDSGLFTVSDTFTLNSTGLNIFTQQPTEQVPNPYYIGVIPAYFIINLTAEYSSNENILNGIIYNNLIPVVVNYLSNPSEKESLQIKAFQQNGFYVHGRAGIFDEINYEDASFDNQILPTKWYDKQEPFEFEFVVNGDVGLHKIFNNLVIISNNVQPDEIEYEIIGDVFDFNKTGIYRKEHFGEDEWNTRYNKPKFRGTITGYRFNLGDEVHTYQQTQKFLNCKINWDFVLNTYTLKLTQKCKNIVEFGRRMGNIQYKEDSWYITIDPIFFREKAKIDDIVEEDFGPVKSARLRDKFIKIRVKYTGEDIAVITAIRTLLTISYA